MLLTNADLLNHLLQGGKLKHKDTGAIASLVEGKIHYEGDLTPEQATLDIDEWYDSTEPTITVTESELFNAFRKSISRSGPQCTARPEKYKRLAKALGFKV